MIIPMQSFFRKDLILFSIHTQLLGLIPFPRQREGKNPVPLTTHKSNAPISFVAKRKKLIPIKLFSNKNWA